MKKIIDIIKSRQALYIVFALGGLLIGWLLFGSPSKPVEIHTNNHEQHNHSHSEAGGETWTCSMHPQIRQDKPGLCPICAMDLVPVRKGTVTGDSATDPNAIQLSEEAIALADVQTSRVNRENPVKQVRLYGKIAPDERSQQSQTAHVSGRIETLNVDFTGEIVRTGQTLATLYSPELFTAQQELLESIRMQQLPLIQAAREKLKLWKMTDAQIAAIEQSGAVSPMTEIKSNTNGIVVAKRVSQGDYVSQGAVLFDVANLSKVWALFDAFEVDLPFLNIGDKVQFTLQALPGKTFTGHISFIDPIINPTTRTARVRVEVINANMELKPEMYTTAIVDAPLRSYKNEIVVPQTAVLWTGKRAIVYVKQIDSQSPTFLMREVELGPSLGGAYVILNGLSEGEEIVTNGVFAIDASAQLEGKRSMMNNESTPPKPMTGHIGHNIGSEHIQFGVKGLCEMCKERIEKTALSVNGVTTAQWDKNSQKLHLQFDPQKTSSRTVSQAIAKAGHDTDMDKADNAVYDKLPGC